MNWLRQWLSQQKGYGAPVVRTYSSNGVQDAMKCIMFPFTPENASKRFNKSNLRVFSSLKLYSHRRLMSSVRDHPRLINGTWDSRQQRPKRSLFIKCDTARPESAHNERSRKAQKRQRAMTTSNSLEDRKSPVRRRKGALESFVQMPLDILFEIFGYLNPLDILRLARTSQALRGILMKRSSSFIWKRARSNLEGLPTCPTDLSEPQYASLAFEPVCHYCFAKNVQTIIWAARVRGCKKCISKKFLVRSELRSKNIFGLPSYDIIPHISKVQRGQKYYSVDIGSTYCQEYASIQANDARIRWIAAKAEEHTERLKHATLCDRWKSKQVATRCSELLEIRETRQATIVQKLIDLGFGEELEGGVDPLAGFDIGKISRKLTVPEWDKMKPGLIHFMQDKRTERLNLKQRTTILNRHKVLKQVYTGYVASQPIHAIIPGPADVAIMNAFSAIIMNTPLDVDVTTEHFEGAMANLPQLTQVWRNDKDAELCNLIMKAGHTNVTSSTLGLATTLFLCHACDVFVGYPQILVHHCNTKLYYEFKSLDLSNLVYDLGCEPLNFRKVSFHRYASLAATSILEACGLSLDITGRDLEDANLIFECVDCNCDVRGRLTMKWQRALYHALESTHTNGRMARWKLLNDDEKVLYMNVIDNESTMLWSHTPDWTCVRCKFRGPLRAMNSHIGIKHDVRAPIRPRDFTLHLDASIHNAAPYTRILNTINLNQ